MPRRPTTCRQMLHGQLGECQSGERCVFRRLDDHRVARGQRRRHLPGKHQQRKVPRDHLADHPASCVVGKFRLQQLRPAGMMVEMPRHQWNVDIAALADGLAVVHRLEHRKAARVLLHLPGESIKIARPLVAVQRLPAGKGFACGGHRGFHVVGVALGHFSKRVARRGIAGGLVFAARRRNPRSANELLEPAMMPLQPRDRFLRIFRRSSVLHGVELLRYAHAQSL